MENEKLLIIELIKSANSHIYPAALHAAKVQGILLVTIGGLVMLISIIGAWVAYIQDWEEFIGFSVFATIIFLFALAIVLVGIYKLSALEFSAFKLILGR